MSRTTILKGLGLKLVYPTGNETIVDLLEVPLGFPTTYKNPEYLRLREIADSIPPYEDTETGVDKEKRPMINDMQYGCMDHIPIMELINFLRKWDLCLVQSANGLAIVKQRKQANGHS